MMTGVEGREIVSETMMHSEALGFVFMGGLQQQELFCISGIMSGDIFGHGCLSRPMT